jgi:predicted permease
MSWWRRKERERDLERELRSHLELEAAERQDDGLAPQEARYAAQRALGNTTFIKESTREMWGWKSVERFWQDLRYSVRMLRGTPGLTAAAVVSLALGIGANTAIFSLLNAVVLRMLPVANPRQLVQFTYTLPLWETADNWNCWFGYPQLERFRAESKTLAGIFGGTRLGRVDVAFHGASELAKADAYTDNFFSVLGVTPQHGRFFSAGEDRADVFVAILSDRYWRSRFGADPSVVGTTIAIDQISFTVIGVTPPEFSGTAVGSAPDLWVPLHTLDRFRPDDKRWTESFASWLLIAGRLRSGVSPGKAQAELDVIHRQLLAEQLSVSALRGLKKMQQFVRDSHLVLRPAARGTLSGIQEGYTFPLKLLMSVAGIVLLVACANVANLLLARASNRRREIAVRMALGAGRGRVVRQLLTESVVLASMGGALAVALAWWGSAALMGMISTGDSPLPLDVHPDGKVFGFAAAVSLLTGILFGLAPAVRGTMVDPFPAMKEGSRHAGQSSHVLDRFLVIAQVAFSVVLVTGAGLFVRTLQKLWSVNLGYDRENVLLFSVDAKLGGYPPERAGAVYREILGKVQSLPGVKSASASAVRPMDDQFYLTDRVAEIDGRGLPEPDTIHVAWNSMSPGYFTTVGMPILLGRDFDLRDDEAAPKVVIVNESFARRAFPNQNPIGHRLGIVPGGAIVVGLVKDSHYNGVRDQPRPVLYHPLFQHGPSQEYRWGFVSFELRYGSRSDLLDEVRRAVASASGHLPIFRAQTLRAQTEQSLLKERLLATLSSYFAALALLLACVGLYGLMAYAVARRTNEIGIRLALGARRGRIVWLVLHETLWLTATGIAAGIPLALLAARYANSMLFGVVASDPLTITVTVATLMGVAALAAYIPARRALRVDPMVALRYE